MNDDIAKILKEIKLPERHTPPTRSVEPSQTPALGVLPTFTPPAAAVQLPQEKALPVVTPPMQQSGDPSEESAATPVESLHTMKTDLQRTVRDRKISVVRAAAMEQDRAAEEKHALPGIEAPRTRGTGKTMLLIVATLVLLGLGGAALYVTYTITQGTPPAQTPVPSTSIIFAEHQYAFPLTGESPDALKQALGGLLTQGGSVGTITQIVPTVITTGNTQGQRPATLTEFFQALGVAPPADLVRALSDNFFFGIHSADTPAPVFIIPVISYDRAFADMLQWEGTIDSDLSPLFKGVPAVTASPSGGVPVARQFKDLVMQNYDVRALEDDSGTIVLYYSFPTPSLLIIAASPYTFPEVLSRLQAERKL